MASVAYPAPVDQSNASGGVMPPLRSREKLSYAAGEVASNLAWNMVAGFLLIYYSDVALLPLAALGTLMLVTRIADAVFDPLVGILVDRTDTRRGKARPYLLYAAIPFGLLTVATFSVPAVSPELKLVYAYVTFTLLGLFYSLLYIPYGAMLPMMTREPAEKVQLGSWRAMGTSLASIFVYSLAMPIVAWVGGTDRQTGFTVAAAVMATVTVGLYYVVYFNCRERLSHDARVAAVPVSVSLRQMVHNPVWRVVFFLALLIFIKLGVMVSSLAFFTKDVLGQPWMVSVILPFLSVAILAGGFIAGFYFRWVGKRPGNLIALAISIVLVLAMPWFQDRPVPFIALFVLSNVVGGIQGATIFILIADAVEVHQKRFDNRAEGLLVSSVSFGMKVGMAIGASLTAYALAIAGYDPARAMPAAVRALEWLFYAAPVTLMLMQMLCIAFYKVDDRPRNVAHVS